MQPMKPEAVDQLVELFVGARERQHPVPVPLPQGCRPPSLEEAYRVQAALNERLGRALGAVCGRKIGCTTPVMQRYLRIEHPCAGAPLRGPGPSQPRLRRLRRALAAGGRVRDRGAPRAAAPRGCRPLRPRGRRRFGRELHRGDRDRGRSLRRLPRPRRGEPHRRRLLQRRRRGRRPDRRVARPRSRGPPGHHDDQRRSGRLGNRRRRDGPSVRGRSPGSPTTPPRPAGRLPRATWCSREASSKRAGWGRATACESKSRASGKPPSRSRPESPRIDVSHRRRPSTGWAPIAPADPFHFPVRFLPALTGPENGTTVPTERSQ